MDATAGKLNRRVARRLRRLVTARIVLLATAFGLSISTAMLVAVGIAYLFVGDLRLLGFLNPSVINAIFVGLMMGAALPMVNRAIVREVRREPSLDLCLPLMEMITGLPIGSVAGPVGEELAAVLKLTNAEWWSANQREMATKVKLAFVALENPSKLHALDSPWVPALFDAMARCGRTELLPRLERLESRSPRLKHPEAVREALSSCTITLRDRLRRDREAATLLRVAEGGDELLLRPAGESASCSENLLRPSSGLPNEDPSPTLVGSPRYESSPPPDVQTVTNRL
jgi:hypothetical protein